MKKAMKTARKTARKTAHKTARKTAHKTTRKITKDCIECKINQWVRDCSESDTLTHTELGTDILLNYLYSTRVYLSFKYHIKSVDLTEGR